MIIPFRISKSAGIPVTPAVRRLIRRADTARRQARWGDAAAAFQAALAADPQLHHIRLQLGHMLKEAGRLNEADAAYAEAARLRPDDAEPVLHQAHLAKRRHQRGAAVQLFIAARTRQASAETEAEIRSLLDVGDVPTEVLHRVLTATTRPDDAAILTTRAGQAPEPVAGGPGASDDRPLVFDITDLVGHFRDQRAPTGIQRVQIEVLERAMTTVDPDRFMMGCFVGSRSTMVAVPARELMALVALARISSDTTDAEWQEARARLFVQLALAEHIVLPFRAVLINLGTSLWVTEYFLFIRNAKARAQISYVPFVHDLIPVMRPQFCIRGIREEFAAWVAGLFQHADGFLANSKSTARDLVATAKYLGHAVAPERVKVVPLDGDFRAAAAPLPPAALERWGLTAEGYALMVSTIEPRKNHVLAFDAWAELFRRHGAAAVPRLVCVGRDGWLNDHVFARLAADPALIAGVTIIHRVSDAEMALLYRCSLFTIYPSHYEGWGLPVTESLCHGRVPVVADNSSLPEAGAGFALLFESKSALALVDAVERVCFDPSWRREQEARIAASFAPRPWEAIGRQIEDAAREIVDTTDPVAATPMLVQDGYYPIHLHQTPDIWPGLISGEIFRIGDGWLPLEADQCRTIQTGAELRFALAGPGGVPIDPAGGVRLYLRLHGLATMDCPVRIVASGRQTSGVVPAGRTMWLACDIAPDAGMTFAVTIHGQHAEEVALPVAGRVRTCLASVGVVGVLVSEAANEAATLRAIATIEGWREARA